MKRSPIQWILCGWLVGCVGEEPAAVRNDGGRVNGSDAGANDASAADATSSPPRCDPAKAFGAGQLVEGLPWRAGGTVGNLSLTADERTVTFTTDVLTPNDGGRYATDLYIATRSTSDGPFSGVLPVMGVNTAETEVGTSISPDGRKLLFARTESGNYQIFPADLAGNVASNVVKVEIAGGTANTQNQSPFQRATGGLLYFASSGRGDTTIDLYRVQFPTNAAAPVPLTELNVAGFDDVAPVLSVDEKRIYFASNRPGSARYDIWVASRTDVAAPFSDVRQDQSLSSATDDFPNWISPDTCVMYFARELPEGGYRAYVAKKPM